MRGVPSPNRIVAQAGLAQGIAAIRDLLYDDVSVRGVPPLVSL
jgi:hypothetical protein